MSTEGFLIRPYILDACGMCGMEIDPKGDDFIGITLRSNREIEGFGQVAPEMGLCNGCGAAVTRFMHSIAVASGMSAPENELKEAAKEMMKRGE
jgi:hypothetical protein